MTQAVSDDVSGKFARQQADWFARVQSGSLDPVAVQVAVQEVVDEQTEKFALLVDLGTITVPADYVHATALTKFREKNKTKFSYNKGMTDKNFSNPTRVLRPGDVLHVRAYVQKVSIYTKSAERLNFLHSKQAILIGAQGGVLVLVQKRHLLPKGDWYASYASMDEENRRWRFGGSARVPIVGAYSDGNFAFDLAVFGGGWSTRVALLCFSDS